MTETNRLARTLRAWQPELLAYFDERLTNGPTEGVNRIIKAVKRQGFGYTNAGRPSTMPTRSSEAPSAGTGAQADKGTGGSAPSRPCGSGRSRSLCARRVRPRDHCAKRSLGKRSAVGCTAKRQQQR